MDPALSARIARSCAQMERAGEMIIDRHAGDPSALGKGTTREMHRIIAGLSSIRRAHEIDLSMIVAGAMENLSPQEKNVCAPLAAALGSPESAGRSWTQIGERLARDGFLNANGFAFRRERLIMLAIAAAGGARYALGASVDVEDDESVRLFDLLNLPSCVGGRAGIAPIVRSCYDGTVKYARHWRFATDADRIVVEPADDDDDLDLESLPVPTEEE